jgi:serine/threonine protein kinase
MAADPSMQSPATMRDMQRLDQYQTVKILGEGSFGKVKLAIHQPSGRQVALKTISRRKLLSRDMVGRVEREIQYLQLLRHPHIIKLYAHGSVFSVLTDRIRLILFDFAGTPSLLPKLTSSWSSSTPNENCSITWSKEGDATMQRPANSFSRLFVPSNTAIATKSCIGI